MSLVFTAVHRFVEVVESSSAEARSFAYVITFESEVKTSVVVERPSSEQLPLHLHPETNQSHVVFSDDVITTSCITLNIHLSVRSLQEAGVMSARSYSVMAE